MFQIFRDIILQVLKNFSKTDENSSKLCSDKILIDIPNDENVGDLYTNSAMVFAKNLGTNPQNLAKSICESLLKNDFVSSAEIAGPGFVNFRLSAKAWIHIVEEILNKKKYYSYSNIKNLEQINVEFVSANPTGPLHTGHARNAVFGSVIVNLLEKIGYKVTKEFYINDQGNQIRSLAKSLYLRYREALGANISCSDFTEDMYCGDYVKELAKDLVSSYQDSFLNKEESEWLDFFSKYAIEKMLESIKSDLKLLGVEMDVYTSEADICKRKLVDEALGILYEYGDIYDGVIPEPKGIDVTDWEERPQTLFRSTKYGDDIDRAIRKSDGTWTYFAGDMAYHLDKIRRGFNNMVGVLGADHVGYVKRLKAVVKAISNGEADIKIQLYQLVNFLENGKPVRMSKRAGNFITLKEVVERVGKDITRFLMISRHHDVMIDFDFIKAVEFSMENPIFYIQYAYARICSVFRNAMKVFPDITTEEIRNCDKSVVIDKSETDLIKILSIWPGYVVSAAKALEPHRIPSFLYQLASAFHSLWNKGKTDLTLRFIDENDKNKTLARLSLLEATKIVIADGFEIIGVSPMEEMK